MINITIASKLLAWLNRPLIDIPPDEENHPVMGWVGFAILLAMMLGSVGVPDDLFGQGVLGFYVFFVSTSGAILFYDICQDWKKQRQTRALLRKIAARQTV